MGNIFSGFSEQELSIETKFGRKVRCIRILKNISQEDLSFRSGLNRNYISDTERGKRNVSLRSIQKIANGLQIDIVELFR